MGDPGYVYQPWSEARKKRARDKARHRFGTKKGCHKVCGVDVPDRMLPEVKRLAGHVRKHDGMEAASLFVKLLVKMPELVSDKAKRDLAAKALFRVWG